MIANSANIQIIMPNPATADSRIAARRFASSATAALSWVPPTDPAKDQAR